MLLKNVLLVANLEDGAGCKDSIRVASKLRSPESLDPERVQASNWLLILSLQWRLLTSPTQTEITISENGCAALAGSLRMELQKHRI